MNPAYAIPLQVLMVLLAGAGTSVAAAPPASGETPALSSAEPAPRDESLYTLGIGLHDQSGAAIGLDVFRGRPVVVAMFYASCASQCPLLISDIQRLEKTLSPIDRERLAVLLVSLDEKHDGPASFQRVIGMHGLDSTRWRLTTASAADVQTLAAVLGVRYSALPKGGFAHSSVLTLLSPRGEMVGRVEGSLQPVDGLADVVARMPTVPVLPVPPVAPIPKETR